MSFTITSPSDFFSYLASFSPGINNVKRQKSERNLLFSRCTYLHSRDPSILTEKASALRDKTIPRTNYDVNTEICRLCGTSNLKDAVVLLQESREAHRQAYCDVLQLCAEVKSLEYGRKVDELIRCSGLIVDDNLGSKLVFMYVNCGDLRAAKRIFETTSKENIFIWNLIMNEHVKIGEYRESIHMFMKMIELGIQPNSYAFSCVLKCYAAVGNINEGEKTHGYLLKLGFDSCVSVMNSLIALYSKSKRMKSAYKVFEEMDYRDVISWNSVISGYISNDFNEKAIDTFINMWFSGVSMDLASFISVLPAWTEFGLLPQGKVIHGFTIKRGFINDIKLINCLIDMYAKCNSLNEAEKIFGTAGKRNVVSWTSLLSGYSLFGQFDMAIKLFQDMEMEGIQPDSVAITSILHACSSHESLDQGKIIHDLIMRNGLESNLFVGNALIDMYAKCGSMEDAKTVFDRMTIKDSISWNTLIRGYSKNRLPNEALSLFTQMQRALKPNCITLACVLPACASLSALERGREIHGYIMRSDLIDDVRVTNALIDMYAKCGALLLASKLFDRMQVKDLYTWTAMIAGYGMHGNGRDAISIFQQMRDTGIEPDCVSFIAILYACSHSGLVDEGWRFFNIMKYDCKIEPTVEHYACVVDLLSRAGHLNKAYKFIEAMPVKPDATIWGSLLCGCRIHRDVELAEKVAEHVFELEPENAGYYVLLANIYAEAEKWESVKKVRERIGRSRLRKNPGCSWIEIKKKVYVFVTGDRSHPQSGKIQPLLRRVIIKMKEEGYRIKKRYALINGDDAVKEEALCGHSEKSAIAFGILNSPNGKIIRVTKNLRVCGDCHEVVKFMSKMFGREIFLRDSNRFHHFVEGRCSCRGFW